MRKIKPNEIIICEREEERDVFFFFFLVFLVFFGGVFFPQKLFEVGKKRGIILKFGGGVGILQAKNWAVPLYQVPTGSNV